jgi:hypothetical protein
MKNRHKRILKEDVASFNVRVLSDIIMEELRTTTEIFNKDSRSSGRHFNSEPPRTRSISAKHTTAMFDNTIKDAQISLQFLISLI